MVTATLASPPTVADTELIGRVRAGDDGAFAALYGRYHRRVAAYVYGMVKDFGRAEDITQDVFMCALRRMRQNDREIAFKPWIYEIAKNACIDQYRRSRRTEEVSFDAGEAALGAADHRRLANVGTTPETAVEKKLALEDLRGALGGLSDVHRDILVMREFEGLSYDEIGMRLRLTRPAVESTLFRARRRLAEEYSELSSGERCVRVQAIVAAAATASLGARDRRKLAAHVSHCQPCRRHALQAGLDPALLRVPARLRSKVAALLPLPLFLRRRLEDADVTSAVSAGSPHVAQWSAQLSALADPSLAASWARAAVAAATIAAAGVGAGVASHMASTAADHGARSHVAVVGGATPVVAQAVRSRTAGTSPAPQARQVAARSRPAHARPVSRPVWATRRPAQPVAASPSGPSTSGGVASGADLALAGGSVPSVLDGAEDARRPHVRRAMRRIVRDTVQAAAGTLKPLLDDARATVADTARTVDGLIRGG